MISTIELKKNHSASFFYAMKVEPPDALCKPELREHNAYKIHHSARFQVLGLFCELRRLGKNECDTMAPFPN